MTCLLTNDLCIVKGDTYVQQFFHTNPDTTAVDLTGYTVTLTVKDRNVLFTLTEGDGLTIYPVDGQIDAVFSSARTSLLDWHGASYDLTVVTVTGAVMTFVGGRIQVAEK